MVMRMTKAYFARWTRGNEKLQKDNGGAYSIIGFGIPADFTFLDENLVERNTCPGALACRAVCYAKQGRYMMRNVQDARHRNLYLSMNEGFIDGIVGDLKRMRKINTVRIHDSGDFYSQTYLNAWANIARALPHLTFYAYTKALHLDLSNLPENLRITQSLGGLYDQKVDLSRSHSRIFSTDEDRIRAGYIDGNVNDVPAIEGLVQIGLVYHGQRKLTGAQAKYFS
jgi:hypothetical protein